VIELPILAAAAKVDTGDTAHGEAAYSTGEGAILVTPEAGVEAEVPVKPI
jgi:hypothetical protein